MVLPNVLITGTPGVGKSRLCKELVERLGEEYKWHNVSQVAKENNCVAEHDDEYDCPVLNEDKLLDYLEPIMAKGGNLVEYHGCDFFPERWFQLVFVIQCDNTILYDRLKKRNYKEKKIKENIECEIFQTILEEAYDSYKKSIIHTLKNENSEDRNKALDTICELIHKKKNNLDNNDESDEEDSQSAADDESGEEEGSNSEHSGVSD